ncbi:MAG: DMT family transporter [Pseudomonadota bacterium]
MSPAMRAGLFGLLAAFFWGTHSVIVRALTADLHGMTIAVLRLYIAAAALYLILRIGKYRVRFDFTDRAFLITCVGAATNYIFFHWGLEYTGASNAMMLENTAPFFVLVLLFVMGQRRTVAELVATVIAVAGVVLTVQHDMVLNTGGVRGDVLEILAGVTWAVFIIGSAKALSTTNSTLERISFLFRVFVVAAVVLTPFAFLEGEAIATVTMRDGVLLLLLGIFPTAVAYFLWYEAAARVSTVTSALLFTLSIIFTFINAALFLGEDITLGMSVGAALIVAGVIISKLGSKGA